MQAYHCHHGDVSILVLVDQSLGVLNFSGLPTERFSFNPCFSGSVSRSENEKRYQNDGKVSILVLVDQSLGGFALAVLPATIVVSILVLVDQSLGAILTDIPHIHIWSFNPCFSGSVSRRIFLSVILIHLLVSILVLVDQSLGECTRTTAQNCMGFNPCFSGSVSRRSATDQATMLDQGFNPCFSGSVSRSQTHLHIFDIRAHVSILVLVDQSLGVLI